MRYTTINKQLQTERGLIYVHKTYSSKKEAEKDGYHYMFTSSMLNADVLGKITDSAGHSRECVIVYK